MFRYKAPLTHASAPAIYSNTNVVPEAEAKIVDGLSVATPSLWVLGVWDGVGDAVPVDVNVGVGVGTEGATKVPLLVKI
jgi:hypothetical protein